MRKTLLVLSMCSCILLLKAQRTDSYNEEVSTINSEKETNKEEACVILPGSISGTQSVCSGDTPSALANVVSASTSGCPGLPGIPPVVSYQWQSKVVVGVPTSWQDISGANSVFYWPSASSGDVQYRRKASYAGFEAYSNSVTVTGLSAVSGGKIYTTGVISGSTVNVYSEVNASGGDPNNATYQWAAGPTSTGPWLQIPGSNSASLSTGTPSVTTFYRRSYTSCGTTVNAAKVSRVL